MSRERDQQEFERYLEYQRAERYHRVETLGGVATMLFLSTIDLGVIGASDSSTEKATHPGPEVTPIVEATPLRAARERKLADFAEDSTEFRFKQAA